MEAKPMEFIRFAFKVHKLCVEPTAGAVALYGSHPCIGEWKKEEALFVPYIGMSEWQMTIMLPKNTKLTYKLLLLHPHTRHVLQEELFDRHLETGETPTLVELTFDDPLAFKSTPMKSKLTNTGSPVALQLPTMAVPRIGALNLNTDDLLRNHTERRRFGTRSSEPSLEFASRLERPGAVNSRSRTAPRPTMVQVQLQTDGHDKLAKVAPPSITKPKCTSIGVNTTEDLLSISASLGITKVDKMFKGINKEENRVERIHEEIGSKSEEETSATNDNTFTFRQMLPSPYRMAMLGLAIGACVLCKVKS